MPGSRFLMQRYRSWRANKLISKSNIRYWLIFLLGLGFGIAGGGYFGINYPQKTQPIKIQISEKKRIEYENRLKIHEQALERLNDINSEYREKYLFLLSQLILNEEQNPSIKKVIVLKHLSIVEINEGVFQYRILIVNKAHSVNTKYFLVFKFTSGESEKIYLDVSNFSLPKKNSNLVLPFLGRIKARGRILEKTFFLVEENNKEIYKTETIYERT